VPKKSNTPQFVKCLITESPLFEASHLITLGPRFFQQQLMRPGSEDFMFNVVSSGQWSAGYLINPNVEPLDQKWLKEFGRIPAAAVSDCLGRNVGGLGLRPFHGNTPMLGGALTVRVRPGDNLMILKAMQMARPGDVLVIDGSADLTRTVFGGIMRAMVLKAGSLK
jgi:hypothetical protein